MVKKEPGQPKKETTKETTKRTPLPETSSEAKAKKEPESKEPKEVLSQEEALKKLAGKAEGDLEAERKEEKPKGRKRGRPRTPPPGLMESLGLLTRLPFDIVAARRGEHWKITKEEEQALSKAVDGVVRKYLASFDKWGEEIALAFALIMVCTPRLMLDRKIEEAKRKAEESKEPKSEPTKD